MPNAAIYARKSTEQNGVADETKSVTRQVELAKACAQRKGRWAFVLAVLMVPLDAAGQRLVTEERETLRGLQGVAVLVESLDADAERDGLRRTEIQTDAELKSRLAGIRVLSEAEAARAVGSPYLYINVNTQTSSDRLSGLYAYSVSVVLRQRVSSLVRPGVTFPATTWHQGFVGTVGASNLGRAVRDNVKDYVDKFVNDYLAVNPKRVGAEK